MDVNASRGLLCASTDRRRIEGGKIIETQKNASPKDLLTIGLIVLLLSFVIMPYSDIFITARTELFVFLMPIFFSILLFIIRWNRSPDWLPPGHIWSLKGFSTKDEDMWLPDWKETDKREWLCVRHKPFWMVHHFVILFSQFNKWLHTSPYFSLIWVSSLIIPFARHPAVRSYQKNGGLLRRSGWATSQMRKQRLDKWNSLSAGILCQLIVSDNQGAGSHS